MSTVQAPDTIKQAKEAFGLHYLLAALEMGQADEAVLRYLQFLTRVLPLKGITFVHVLPKLEQFSSDLIRHMQQLLDNFHHQDEVQEEMAKQVANYLNVQSAPRLHFSTRQGNPLEEVLIETHLSGADLLVVGQRAKADSHGILSRNLVRKTNANALIVPENSKAQLKTIVVPVDFSPHSVRALETAVQLNQHLQDKAKLIAVNVFELPAVFSYKVRNSYEALKVLMEDDRKAAFKDFLQTYAPDEDIEMALIEQGFGNVGAHLFEFCEAQAADLVVLGAKGHSKVELLLLGSVSEKLLALNKTIPTLIVK